MSIDIEKPRKILYSPSLDDVMRIKALSIITEPDPETKENQSREFEPVLIESYEKVVCGEDWYIALLKNGTYEEVVLSSADPKAYEEIEQIKQVIELNISNEKSL